MTPYYSWCHRNVDDGCRDDLQFYFLFNSISVVLVRWEGDNKRLCMCSANTFTVEKNLSPADFEPWTA